MARRKKQKFPREFRKKFRHSLERDFLFILLLSLLFHFGIISFLLKHVPARVPFRTINKIQEQFATALMNRTAGTIQFPAGAEKRNQQKYLTVTAEAGGAGRAGRRGGGSGTGSGGAGGTGGAEKRGGIYGNGEAGLPTMGEISARGGAGSGRGQALNKMADDMRNVGFLGVLTSGGGYVPSDYINDISNYGDVQNTRLGERLSSLDAMEISRGRGGKGTGSGSGNGSGGIEGGTGGVPGVRGGGRRIRAIDVDDLLTNVPGTGKVNFNNINRTPQNFVQVSQNIVPKPPVPVTPEEKAQLRRKPDHVQAVIDRHKSAITECYKRMLKDDPTLKGKVEVRFAVDPDGHVSWTEIVTSTFTDAAFNDCLTSKIKNWNDFGYGDPTAPDEVYRQVFTFGY
jgi:hypothetical protein